MHIFIIYAFHFCTGVVPTIFYLGGLWKYKPARKIASKLFWAFSVSLSVWFFLFVRSFSRNFGTKLYLWSELSSLIGSFWMKSKLS